jgi:hypothetical protein
LCIHDRFAECQAEVNPVKVAQLATLRFFSLLFLLPGLAGMLASATISTYYLNTLPKSPAPEEMRLTPRNIHGTVVYQTPDENRRLNLRSIPPWGSSCWGLGRVWSIGRNGAQCGLSRPTENIG